MCKIITKKSLLSSMMILVLLFSTIILLSGCGSEEKAAKQDNHPSESTTSSSAKSANPNQYSAPISGYKYFLTQMGLYNYIVIAMPRDDFIQKYDNANGWNFVPKGGYVVVSDIIVGNDGWVDLSPNSIADFFKANQVGESKDPEAYIATPSDWNNINNTSTFKNAIVQFSDKPEMLGYVYKNEYILNIYGEYSYVRVIKELK